MCETLFEVAVHHTILTATCRCITYFRQTPPPPPPDPHHAEWRRRLAGAAQAGALHVRAVQRVQAGRAGRAVQASPARPHQLVCARRYASSARVSGLWDHVWQGGGVAVQRPRACKQACLPQHSPAGWLPPERVRRTLLSRGCRVRVLPTSRLQLDRAQVRVRPPPPRQAPAPTSIPTTPLLAWSWPPATWGRTWTSRPAPPAPSCRATRG